MTDSASTDESLSSEETTTDRIWADGFILLVHIILPIAITGIILGRKTIFSKVLAHLDRSCIAVFYPSFSKQEKLRKWITNILPHIDSGLQAIWKDGSLLCTIINSVVPGACPNPHRHWKKPPTHGQALAYKYLGVAPVFTEKDFKDMKLTTPKENLLFDYLCSLQQAIDKLTPNSEEITFSTRYIARGMGLVTGEQHRKTIIYIYPNFKGQMDDLLINIRGPYNTYGSARLSARDFLQEVEGLKQPAGSKGQKSFLKTLSSDFTNLLKAKEKGPACDIEIRTEFEKDRAKIAFIPNNSGVYEMCLTTNGEHISGSPYNLNIEKNRSGVCDNLTEEPVKMVKNPKRKVLNTVIYYEKLKKGEEAHGKDDMKVQMGGCDQDKCEITLGDLESSDKKEILKKESKNVDLFAKEAAKFKEIGEKMKDINISEVKDNKEDVSHEVPILETLQELDNLLDSNLKKKEIKCPEIPVNKPQNYGLSVLDTLRDISAFTPGRETNPEVELNNEITEITEPETKNMGANKITDIKRKIFAYNKPNTIGTSQNDLPNLPFNSFPSQEPDTIDHSPTIIQEPEIQLCEHIFKKSSTTLIKLDSNPGLDDSGTYDIDPDSLTSSVELQGSTEEISSDNSMHEVNNNDIMVKSNEDICYLILDQSDQPNRVYSKDFVSCKDDRSKDDLSKSDPNLNGALNASALSQDNVQEAHHRRARPSRIFQKHPQEGLMAGTRGHSYSYNSLIEANNRTEIGNEDGSEFKEHFLKRKAFWTNISMSNLNDSTSIGGLQQEKPIRAESARSVHDEVLKSRSLDFVRQRKKSYGYEIVSRDVGKYGSVDDLNFPSVRDTRDVYLNQRRVKTLEKPSQMYAVRGDKYSWSIHDKIKCFEASTLTHESIPEICEKTALPENVIVKSKIKEGFEKAHNYFKDLESKSYGPKKTVPLKRRYSLDADTETNLSLAEKFASLRHVIRDIKVEQHPEFNPQKENTKSDILADRNNEEQVFLTEHRRKRPSINELFNK